MKNGGMVKPYKKMADGGLVTDAMKSTQVGVNVASRGSRIDSAVDAATSGGSRAPIATPTAPAAPATPKLTSDQWAAKAADAAKNINPAPAPKPAPSILDKAKGMLGLKHGGKVPGKGNTDKVKAMLTPGEFVMPKDTTKKIGAKNLSRVVAATHKGMPRGRGR